MIFISGKLKGGASRLLKLITFRANTVSQAQLFTVSHMTYTLMLWWSACLLITFPCRWVEQNISSTGVFPQLNSTLHESTESVHVLEHLSIRSSCVWWLLTSTPALIFHYKLTWGWCSCWWRPADSGGRTYFCCCSDPCDAPFRIPPELHETWRLK